MCAFLWRSRFCSRSCILLLNIFLENNWGGGRTKFITRVYASGILFLLLKIKADIYLHLSRSFCRKLKDWAPLVPTRRKGYFKNLRNVGTYYLGSLFTGYLNLYFFPRIGSNKICLYLRGLSDHKFVPGRPRVLNEDDGFILKLLSPQACNRGGGRRVRGL